MLEDLVRRLRALDLVLLRDDALDTWAEEADKALQEAADALQDLHKAVEHIAQRAQEALRPQRLN